MTDRDPQVELGMVLLGRAKNPEAIASAVGMLGDSADPRIRQVIAQKYAWLNAEPRRRDSGCFQRTALVRALRGRAATGDVGLLETALWTIEIIGRFDAASELRAARLLAMREQLLPLYGLVANGGGTPDVRAECLRGLTGLPVSLVARLIEQYRDEKDATVMVGVFDLVLGHPSRSAFAGFTASFLDRSQSTFTGSSSTQLS